MSWKKEISEIRLREKLAKQQGGSEAVKLQHDKGRLTLRERIDILLDDNSFEEMGKIAGGSEVDDKGKLESLTPANFILGFGKINERNVDVQITRLRKKIEPDPTNPRHLKTIRGRGYRFLP